MAAAIMLDDPDHINVFLSMIGASPITARVVKTVHDEGNDKPTTDEQPSTNKDKNKTGGGANNPISHTTSPDLNKENAGTVTPEVRSRAHSNTSSPAVGTKAPPQTPVGTSITTEAAVKLEPIEEDETDVLAKLAEVSKFRLVDSRFASMSGLRYPVAEYKPATLSSTAHNDGTPGRTKAFAPTPTPKIKKDMANENSSNDYIDNVVAGFQMEHMNASKKDDEALKRKGQSSQQMPATTSIAAQNPLAATKNEYEAATPIKPVEKVSQDVHTAESRNPMTRTGEVEIDTNPTQGTAISTIESKVAGQEEDREYLKHFKSWGKPEARDKPAARVRRITLSGLPADADLTLVQSLVHGGVIDDLILKEASGLAYVRFTSADACDTYCAKYPNGMMFKYRGRSYTVFIDKCKDVDIISGLLQGYIDCGASRCVRAIGADEDWGMGALRKLAEGKSRKGKVENITDVFRNGVRTIVFRFTSIGDAVTFKATLMRDEDWEACNIQFAVDPCEKAAGVHLE